LGRSLSLAEGGYASSVHILEKSVHAHGGEITLVPASADRSLGGATFRITLPQRRKKQSSPVEAA
jgi:K+-sensing histidine kinase KdpD